MKHILHMDKYLSLNESIKLYHGTIYDFSFFDTNNIGTGDGKSVHGYGFYFTESREIAEFYCNELGRSKKKFIYLVRIANDNFLDWDSTVDEEDATKILHRYKKIEQDERLISDLEDALGLSEGYYGDFILTNSLYGYLEAVLGSKKDTSKFLNKCGFDGIKFNSKENGFNSTNYVIFDIGNIKIIDKTEF